MAEKKPSYWEQLRDPRWQRKRLEIMKRDGWACRDCGKSDKTLNVHHGYYQKGYAPWEYTADSLTTLCEPCHELRTDHTRLLLKAMCEMGEKKFFDLVIYGALGIWGLVCDEKFEDPELPGRHTRSQLVMFFAGQEAYIRSLPEPEYYV